MSSLRTHHFSWENDCLVIDMSRHKGDQSGDDIEPKHIYSNPWEPSICPVLALALHMFPSFRSDNEDTDKIFLGTTYDVFSKWMSDALSSLQNLGFDVKDFGTHSFRKGIVTMCSGFIAGPSVIAIFIRAGWSLGNVRERYILGSGGGDYLCGRVASGLDFNSGSKFTSLPAHFANSAVLDVDDWLRIAPEYNKYPAGFQACLPYMLAAIVYHYDWLNQKNEYGQLININSNHTFFFFKHFRVLLITSIIVARPGL